MKRSLLIDAAPLLYKGFYVPVFKDMKSINNIPVNAVYPFLKMLFSIQKANQGNDFIGVFFDSPNNKYRKTMFTEYKGHRKRVDPSLIPQFQIAKQMLQYLGIRWIEESEFEGDDLLASYSHHLSQQKHQVTVVTTDKDLYQLVNEHVKVFDPTKKILVDDAFILAKYGIKPFQMRDFLSLTGDASDNIPGVSGIGPKSATKLIGEYESIPNLIKNIASIKPPRVQKLIQDNLQNLEVSYELVKLRHDAKIQNLSDLEYKSFDARLFEYLKELKFFSIIQTLENIKNLRDIK